MKLFTKEVDKQLFAQYPKGSDLDNQMVVAKIFNPYGRGVWYLLNSDPEDPDYIWAIVDLFEPDMGSVSRSELQTVKVPPFGLGLERDIYFTPKPAKEVFEGIMRGERFAYGGMTAGRYYKDNSGNELRYIGESEGKLLFKDGEKIVTKSEEDFEDSPKEYKLFGIFAEGGETQEYIVWVSKDGEKRELFGEYKSKRAADMQMNKLWPKGEYKQMGNKPKSMYEKEGFYADGGRVKGKNNNTGESYGVVIGSVKKSDEDIDGGTEMNVRTSYSSRISEVKLLFDKNGNLYEITDFGYALEGKYPDTSRGSGHRYNADKKETLEVLSKEYNPAFAKKLIELAKDIKMAEGGMLEHGLKIGDKITSDMFWDNQIVVENQKTKKRAQINLETGERKEEMGMGGDTAAAEHNIKQAKYGARLVGKQKNLDVNKNGKLDAEDFKMLRGEKMAMGGELMKHKYLENVSIQLIEPTNKGWKVKQIETHSINGRKLSIPKEKVAYFSKEEIRDLFEPKMAMGGKVKFEDKVKAVKESLLKRKKVSPKVQKDYGKTYDRKEALEAAKRIVGAQTAKYELKKKFKKGGKTIAQTPAPKKDRVFGSSKNKAGSASSKKTASKIELNESIVKTLGEKAKKYNENHSSKVSTSTLKAVMRRGMGAYSTSHRPTITGGAPNSRQAWGFARVNKFLLKKGGTKVKAAYVQDDDLL
jgi:hypothetical protein